MLRAIPDYPHIAEENLTIAFYVGGMRDPLREDPVTEQTAREELQALITSVIEDTPQEDTARLFRCGKIGQPVISFHAHEYAISAELALESSGRVTLIVDPEFANEGSTSVSIICDMLMQEIGHPLCEARFSYRGGRYLQFTHREKQFIEESTE